MKNYLLLFLSIVAMTCFSCGADDEMSQDPEFLTAKIDGVEFNAGVVTALNGGFIFQISGIDGQESMAFSLNNLTVTVGTYDFNGGTCIGSFENATDSWSAESGSIEITKFEDGVIEGTFDFIGDKYTGGLDPTAPDIVVTEGSFSAKVN